MDTSSIHETTDCIVRGHSRATSSIEEHKSRMKQFCLTMVKFKALTLNKLKWHVKRFNKRLCNFNLTETVISQQLKVKSIFIVVASYLLIWFHISSGHFSDDAHSTLSQANFIPKGFLPLFRFCNNIYMFIFSIYVCYRKRTYQQYYFVSECMEA